MTEARRKASPLVPAEFGVPIESALAQRERFANQYDYDFGQERIFPELVPALLDEIPDDSELLEVGAATGLLTGPLLSKAKTLTALEPSPGLLRRLVSSDVASDPRLGTMLGMAEDLAPTRCSTSRSSRSRRAAASACSTCSRRSRGHVRDRVVMLLDDDGSLDWAYLARAAALQGFDVRMHLVAETGVDDGSRGAPSSSSRELGAFDERIEPEDIWEFESRTLDVPYPGASRRRHAARALLHDRRRPRAARAHAGRGHRAPLRQPAHGRAPPRPRRGHGAPHR